MAPLLLRPSRSPTRGRPAGSPGGGGLPPPRRERGGTQVPPEAPGTETTAAQDGEVSSGETKAEVEERDGPAEEMGTGE